MADLEDRYLRQNVPGRWSSIDEKDTHNIESYENDIEEADENDIKISADEALLQDARNLSIEGVPDTIRRGILAERERKTKTGVKGVIADYKAAVKMEQAAKMAKDQFRRDILTRMAEGTRVTSSQQINNVPIIKSEDEVDDDQDKLFMEEFRRKRLQEMQITSTLPVFGSFREVDSSDFSDEIDETDPRVFVVVHLYETSIQSCILLNRHLEQMAVTNPHIKFLRMNASLNEVNIALVAMPMLTVYRAGDTVNIIAAVESELGPKFTADDVEWLLETNGVTTLATMDSNTSSRNTKSREIIHNGSCAILDDKDDDFDLES